MAKVEVYIEEHLVKKIEVEVPDSLPCDERMEIAENQVLKQYKNEEIILTAEDANGIRLKMVRDAKTGLETEWKEF